MKYLLLDIDDTLAPLNYKGPDAVFINKMNFKMSIPAYIAIWLRNLSSDKIRIVWCTSRPLVVQSLVEKKLMFNTYGRISFINKRAYTWYKLFSIIKYCNEHHGDIIILVDNDAKLGTMNVDKFPNNLIMVYPSDTRRGCLSINDLLKIENL
ncbi:hypothetical protein [Companilactobacillus furfuricola]|uniref:hypothetical protein n=1 Tax=Companilactobacillus furfuricola TaxID=1462575 RepID=UPI000F7B9369|nr:hypothetical protein [Companilactobacillus furfuricola]